MLFKSVDGGDIRMIERREELRLADEAIEPFGIGTELGGQHLESDLPAQPGVARFPHLAHATFADGGGDFIVAEKGYRVARGLDDSM